VIFDRCLGLSAEILRGELNRRHRGRHAAASARIPEQRKNYESPHRYLHAIKSGNTLSARVRICLAAGCPCQPSIFRAGVIDSTGAGEWDGWSFQWELDMRKFVIAMALLVIAQFSGREAAAMTTYSYVDQPLSTNCTVCSPEFDRSTLTGSVSFNFDTTGFSGSIFLTDGDQANLFGAGFFSFNFPADPTPPPGTVIWFRTSMVANLPF
jgi:hypothetical protein